MHKVFGEKHNAKYLDREGAYLIPVQGKRVAVVKTPKGYFFLGGGLEKCESHEECIKRECIEEAGYTSLVKEKVCSAETYTQHHRLGHFHPIQTYYTGELLEKIVEPTEADHEFLWIDYEQLKGKLFSEMQNWALDLVFEKASQKTS